ncbi:MAG: hypothetical protein MJZ46_05645, partial [Bacteroidales bacterium]|nr:hypothetical protein [Bacteroidales bacterium]
ASDSGSEGLGFESQRGHKKILSNGRIFSFYGATKKVFLYFCPSKENNNQECRKLFLPSIE